MSDCTCGHWNCLVCATKQIGFFANKPSMTWADHQKATAYEATPLRCDNQLAQPKRKPKRRQRLIYDRCSQCSRLRPDCYCNG